MVEDQATVPQVGGLSLIGDAQFQSEVIWLYIANGIAAVFPLMIIVHVAPTVGIAAWGQLAIADGLGRYVMVFVDYGLQLSGARQVAEFRERPIERGQVVSGIIGSQFVVLLGSLPLVISVAFALLEGPGSALLIGGATVLGAAQAMALSWYFQAVGEMRRFVWIDIVSRSVAFVAIHSTVRGPSHVSYVLAIQALCSLGSLLTTVALVKKNTPLFVPGLRAVSNVLVDGLALFAYRACGTLYISLNVVILGFFASSPEVGAFAAAERLGRLVLAGLYPLSQLFFVKISRLRAVDREAARVLARKAASYLTVVATGGGLFLALVGPTVGVLVFGAEFRAAAGMIRGFGLVVVLASINTVIVCVWLLPARRDRVMSGASMCAGIANVIAATVLVPRFGGDGMLLSLVIAETVILCVYVASAIQLRDPLTPVHESSAS